VKIRIVLVEPLDAGNVGAAARAMKNFGITDLWIVGGRTERTDNVSAWWAVGALDVVESATRVDTLEEALAECHLTVATTAVRARQVHEQLVPDEVSQLARETLADDHRLAVVFGREKNGLTAAEVAMCQRTASIPTDPAFPTMNLAQSVALFCYELGKDRRSRAKETEPAPHHLLQRLNRHTRELLEQTNFFHDKSPDRICAELQALEGRAMLSVREASLLLGMIRAFENRDRTG
jgi:TrmH family RNA methyltransferase